MLWIIVICSLNVVWLLHTLKGYAIYDFCDSGIYSRVIINMFFVGQVSGLLENFNIWIYSNTISVIKVKLYMILLLSE